MNPTPTLEELSQTDVAQLLCEAERYLDAVAVFRAEGCEPVWRNDEVLGAHCLAGRSAASAAESVGVGRQ